jgi:hypothetical protein
MGKLDKAANLVLAFQFTLSNVGKTYTTGKSNEDGKSTV